MTHEGIRDGDELAIVVYRDGVSIGEIIIKARSVDEVVASVYTDDAHTLIVLHEALKASLGCVGYHMAKPTLRQLLNSRIAELNEEIASEEGVIPPSPADDFVGDIPF